MSRSGIGYDVHRFAAERKLILGGVEIPYMMGLDGHSDADVLSHAIADSLLGAAAEPDIGHLFSNTDPTIAGISSLTILSKVRDVLAAKGYRIVNVDSTVVAEAPKISPHLAGMKANISKALGIEPADVGVKATTNESMGFIGREEGIAALAVASIEKN
ncbi:MAG TPA: 2-C-methyl-D-erythritol 2,4-cyclodiphosphate synthase [Chthoniobacterales bacterium]